MICRRPHSRRRGVASVLAMLYLIIFSALAIGFYAATTIAAQLPQNEKTAADARLAAEAGVQFIRYHLAALDIPAGLTADLPGFICREVAVELVWVLERRYGFPRAEIAAALEGLLAAAEIAVEAAGDVGTAIVRYRDEGLGFADQMIAAAARRSGASRLVTFDRRAARLESVELLQA